MEQLTPIPTPPSQRWREFRVQALPVITFIAVLACIAVLWQRYVFPSNIVAQVETTTAAIVPTSSGLITDLRVTRFQQVKKGDVIAVISISETNLIAASMDTVMANLEVMKARIDLGDVRNQQIYERERLTYLEEKAQLQVDVVNTAQAEAKFRIQEGLYTNVPPLVDSNTYIVAKYDWEIMKTKVAENEKFLKEKEVVLPKLLADTSNTVSAIQHDIQAQQAKIAAATSNLVLLAPIDGIVTVISNHVGERVMAGTPIVTISGLQADRIVAWMRQPITTLPKAGDTLQVRRRTFQRQAAIATVRDVGTQLEPIIPALQAPAGAPKVDLGLPFAINMPPSLKLLPGEIVDIIYEPKQH